MDFYQLENQDAVRFTWNNLPNTKVASAKAVIPITCLYTPTKDLEGLALVEYDPIKCKCGAVVNPYCQIDYRTKVWLCQFCNIRNSFPQHYADYMTETNLPAEIMPQYSTIEYIASKSEYTPNVFLFVIDTCLISNEELDSIKNSIQQSLNIIPPDSYVGLITYGRFIFVHELGYSECPKCYAFNGTKEYQPQQIQDQLGISSRNDPRGAQSKAVFEKFLIPLQDCEFTFNSILDDLQRDPWIVPNDERQQRATGSAFNVAISLLEASGIKGQRIMSFLGGACTVGPGQVVDLKMEMTLRSFNDLQKENDNTKFFKKALKYYQGLTQRAIQASMVVDIFAFSLDQFGLLEMRSLSEKTGGYIIVNEEYNSDVFRDTYSKIFEKDSNGDLKMGFSAKMDMFVSKDLKICGAIGPCQSLKNKNFQASEVEIGQGGTNSWFLGGLDRCTTLAIYLDLAAQNNQITKATSNKFAFLQFQTFYKHSSGKYRLRVTTLHRKFAEENNLFDLAQGFDQEAGCVAMARLGVLKTETEEPLEVLKWLDRSLIRLICRFAEYKKDEPQSFRLAKEFLLFPQFMYHLRRSHFIQVFGISPDECTFYRSNLLRENTTNSLVMIQPALLQYSFDTDQPIPVQLDIENLKNNVILLLDTYFHVVVWQGKQIKQWTDAKYHEMPEYENFKQLLQAPQEDVKLIMEDRFPAPILINTFYNHSKERYLKSKVNPSSIDHQSSDSENYLTDDASLKIFMDHLIKLVVQSAN